MPASQCSGGLTGHAPNSDKNCQGVCFGPLVTNASLCRCAPYFAYPSFNISGSECPGSQLEFLTPIEKTIDAIPLYKFSFGGAALLGLLLVPLGVVAASRCPGLLRGLGLGPSGFGPGSGHGGRRGSSGSAGGGRHSDISVQPSDSVVAVEDVDSGVEDSRHRQQRELQQRGDRSARSSTPPTAGAGGGFGSGSASASATSLPGPGSSTAAGAGLGLGSAAPAVQLGLAVDHGSIAAAPAASAPDAGVHGLGDGSDVVFHDHSPPTGSSASSSVPAPLLGS